MLKFHLIASGSKGNCLLIQYEKANILIDCGGPVTHIRKSLKELGLTLLDIHVLFITHGHSDHIGQIKYFQDKVIYSPIVLKEMPNVHLFKVGTRFNFQDMSILSVPLSHDSGVTVGYIIEAKNEKLVYITDTGYVHQSNVELMKDADYIILESNHDIEMLMQSNRPMYLKNRIKSDIGHLCNDDCARVLEKILCPKTKMVILAHISQETNTYELALKTNVNYLCENCLHQMCPQLRIVAAKQFEMLSGGKCYETDYPMDSISCTDRVEWLFESSPQSKQNTGQ